MARPRRQIYTMKQYLDNGRDGYISNNAITQRYPKWKSIVDGLAVTVLTDDYIPPIILAEEESGRIIIVDGGSRTAAFKMICEGNYKIKSSVEDPIISYKKMDKDENGKIVWSDAEFDIRNKTFEQFPKELQKKFYEYQVETVIHECGSEKIAKYLRRYNIHTPMNANEKMFLYLPKFAEKIRELANMQFFINHSDFKDVEKEKGLLERTISEAVMCMYHLNDWNRQGKNIATYLNENATIEEFNCLGDNLHALEGIIADDVKDLFSSKDCFIWLALYGHFKNYGINDIYFAGFLREFKNGLRNKKVNGKLFDTIDENSGTKDKVVVIGKLNILKSLMEEYLNISDMGKLIPEEFVSDVVGLPMNIVKDEIKCYEETLDLLEKNSDMVGSILSDDWNKLSLLAMVAYSYKNDLDLDEWMVDYAKRNSTYIVDQKKNYLHMLDDFKKYQRCMERKAV